MGQVTIKGKTSATQAAPAGNKPAMGFLKTGKAAAQAEAQEDVKKEQRDAEKGGVRRFWLPENKETVITFLDGNLDADGIFENPCYAEHNMFLNGHWRNWFPCVSESEACPLCELAEDKNSKTGKATLVTLFTAIDHSEFESGSKVYKDQVRLFVAKLETVKKLRKMATKYDGLAGVTFEVSRGGNQTANVGDTFIYDQKNSLVDLQNTFGAKDKQIIPFTYSDVVRYYTAAELSQMGISGAPAFGQSSQSPTGQGGNQKDLSSEL